VNVISKEGHIDAIGAKVKVIAGDLTQTAVISGGQGIMQSSLMLEFGLGAIIMLILSKWHIRMVQSKP